MAHRTLACRGLTKKGLQCGNSIGCWHHSCKDNDCNRRKPHTAHNIGRLARGQGERYLLSQSEKASRAGINEVSHGRRSHVLEPLAIDQERSGHAGIISAARF